MGNKLAKFPKTSKLSCFQIKQQQEDDSFTDVHDDPPVFQNGKSSIPETDDTQNPSFVCEICDDSKPLQDSFNVKGCSHFYCSQCTIKYIASKLDDNVTYITCPVSNCGGVLEFEYCRLILPYNVFVRWGDALCESAIVDCRKFYCPYRDCSVMLINEEGERINQSKCPFCRRLFCVKCKVPWHTEFECGEFQKLQKLGEEAVLSDLAKKKKWQKCPKCKIFVEKSFGCCYIKCRCGSKFCYKCGYGLQSSSIHQCPKCNR